MTHVPKSMENKKIMIIREIYVKSKKKLQQYLSRIKDKSIHQKAALQLSNTKLKNKHGALLWLLHKGFLPLQL